MLSVATAASAIRDSFSRNNSDSEQSKDDISDSQKQSDKTGSLSNTRLSKKKGLSTPPRSASISSTPKEENKQLKTDVDVESSICQKNLAETAEPTTNVDTTQVVFKPSPSNSVASLKIEHFDDFDDDLTTPIAGDITSQIPSISATLSDKTDSLSNINNDANSSRKQSLLLTKPNSAKSSKQKKRSRGPSGSIIDEGSIMDSPPLSNYAPAAPRRNAEFHALFRSVPEDDYLINGRLEIIAISSIKLLLILCIF
jgi:hypothetical protein